MSRLYPPIISDVIPAAYISGNNIQLNIPHTLNTVVSANEIQQIQVLIRNVSSNTDIFNEKLSYNLTEKNLSFVIPITSQETNKFYSGTFYKIQIAYVDMNDTIGYYSNTGIFKCTSLPHVEIEGLKDGKHELFEYKGIYTSEDKSERPYSYRFTIKEKDGSIYDDSGVLIHNAENDTAEEISDTWYPNRELEFGKEYTMQYIVTTGNNLVVASEEYELQKMEFGGNELELYMSLYSNSETGTIEIHLNPNPGEDNQFFGTYWLKRQSEVDGFTNSELLLKFEFYDSKITDWKYIDFTVENGIRYKYYIQRFNNNGYYSAPVFGKDPRNDAEEIIVNFEHMYLFDGERQLAIKFNPKVTSFKTTRLETKIDTIGGKYPFIHRNGNVCYKEFPISGLLSSELDTEGLFFYPIPEEQQRISTGKNDNITRALKTKDPYYREKEFKLFAMDWLSNGKPKLFRSPTEGNYLVQLINVTLSPQESLARRLHSFQATAYEIDEITYNNLVYKYNIIYTENKQLADTEQQYKLRSKSYLLETINLNENILPKGMKVVGFNIQGALPRTKVCLAMGERTQEMMIGVSGGYNLKLKDNVKISSIAFMTETDSPSLTGTITVYYYSKLKDDFELIQESNMYDILGMTYDGSVGLSYINKENQDNNLDINILDIFNRPFSQRYYVDPEDKTSDYNLLQMQEKFFITKIYGITFYHNGKATTLSDCEVKIKYPLREEKVINLYNTLSYTWQDIEIPESIKIGKGISCDISLRVKEVVYEEGVIEPNRQIGFVDYIDKYRQYLDGKVNAMEFSKVQFETNMCDYIITVNKNIANYEGSEEYHD